MRDIIQFENGFDQSDSEQVLEYIWDKVFNDKATQHRLMSWAVEHLAWLAKNRVINREGRIREIAGSMAWLATSGDSHTGRRVHWSILYNAKCRGDHESKRLLKGVDAVLADVAVEFQDYFTNDEFEFAAVGK